MRRLRNVVRIIILTITIVLAVAGVGIFGAFIPVYRERFMDNEIRIEMIDKKKTKEENPESKEKR